MDRKLGTAIHLAKSQRRKYVPHNYQAYGAGKCLEDKIAFALRKGRGPFPAIECLDGPGLSWCGHSLWAYSASHASTALHRSHKYSATSVMDFWSYHVFLIHWNDGPEPLYRQNKHLYKWWYIKCNQHRCTCTLSTWSWLQCSLLFGKEFMCSVFLEGEHCSKEHIVR